ncbi:hypothetical protein B0T10DRAFT_513959 [Thelonectria olida]|uniref:Zn(2)-C6 fungal-type domain-containing protein n=1 Tax=Thelonectria olida TaxID=1576542 RepID=A0A9P8W515_9HYPO|nr:hypothetical protein B0T10DRAFT_513959 [Thelonectria olida]
MPALMIYGATGYTGRLATFHAKKLGIDFVLAGRTEATVKDFSSHLNAPYRVFDVTNSELVDLALENLDSEAKEAKVMLLPGCGGSVAMLGCLAGHVVDQVAAPTNIDIALFVAGSISRGSAISAAENLTTECLQRVDGRLTAQNTGDTLQFDFNDGKGPVAAYPVTLPDLITIWRSTNVANIRTFVHVTGNAFLVESTVNMPDGPTAEQREASPYHAAVIVTTADGAVKQAVLHTVNGYTFTSIASVEAAKMVLGGRFVEGFQTPADVFGNDFLRKQGAEGSFAESVRHCICELRLIDEIFTWSVTMNSNGQPIPVFAELTAIASAGMASQTDPLTCFRCSQRFTQKSSLVRHSKRCLNNIKPPSRQKACRQCSASKLRCDLQQPSCGRCQTRVLRCEFVSRESITASASTQGDTLGTDEHLHRDGGELNEPASSPGNESPEAASSPAAERIPPRLVISDHRRQVLLGTAPSAPSSDVVVKHTMHFVIRVLKSWPRLMAAHDTDQLPPILHRLQLSEGVPTPLANCYTLVKMWAGHTDGSRSLVRDTILQEVRRLLDEHSSYNKSDLLATAQSILVLLTILLFGIGQTDNLRHPVDAQLLVGAWDVKHHLAATGLFLEQESNQTIPPWKQWAIVSSKRRTIIAFHHLEWAWSILHGYPTLTCFELGPLPAPAPRYLWRETNEKAWKRLYDEWLRQWKDGSYKMAEFFEINPGGSLDERSEMWLAEADEFGMMLMAEGKYKGPLVFTVLCL